ncbi:alkaline phosphatase family protein [Ancylomarina euxinus]|uniref:Alkaline phosphatase family protein n=1 Tax=Ancylomarina euxinus TaxID=2283627 RepID=A0A425Y3P9_9BACT|nr:LTA synthase family protein [Ancylomarina euxinus]MCZ4694474.1 LTA synthase family protein [Ancylomarina euxinus]MUP14017.1 sulfatase-like hydrolase/transferase [Ancylomarina euxinus]RRG22879.1 alkaline phosphatase family protein [Ancylomarina euxinus]
MKIKNILQTRYGGLILFSLIFLSLSFLIRTILLITDFQNADPSFVHFLQIYAYGLFYDLVTISYFIVPFVFYLLLVPSRIYRTKIHKWVSYVFFIITIGILVFSGIGEWFFWEEFSVRYNFIAVDYLVYTHEVIANIRESYPMPIIILGMLLLSAGIFAIVKKHFDKTINSETRFVSRLKYSLILCLLPILAFYSIDKSTAEVADNSYSNELAHNGIYQIFAAFINNELDYKAFYQDMDEKEAFTNLRSLLKTSNSEFVSDDVFDVTRQITYPGVDKKYNVMLITVESLSASFLTHFGNTETNITPNLDTIAQQSLFFTNFYATGTRTVRGMEALTLSLPPTPGFSIVKRPNNENMFTLGNVLKSKGYATNFIYAGNGYFDNMNYFFGNSGYDIIDHKNFSDDEITFENAWGVCDEDLFTKAIQVADSAYKDGKPFHNFIMTTSNHRPYTYPEGKIDIPSHSGRKGAVKYTDYAIAKFFRDAKKHPWFKNTIFVVVADHCASSAGKTSLPVKKYHIPLFIYAPEIIPAAEINTLSSQIDFAPTILGLLNMDYTSKFFGKDILLDKPNRALLGTYQKIGLLRNDQLTVQLPTKRTEAYLINDQEPSATKLNPEELKDAITYYQTASYLFHHKLYNYTEK